MPLRFQALIAFAFALCLSGTAGGCKENERRPRAVGPADARPTADALQPDSRTTVFSADFTVAGCPRWDGMANVCRGTAPFDVTFVPITSEAPQRVLWTFDETGNDRSTERTPKRRYTLPGVFSVSLLAVGENRTAMKTKMGFIVVEAAPLGGTCEVESQCGPGLTCLCGSAQKCPEAFLRGLCVKSCDTACSDDSVCVDLTARTPVVAPGAMPAETAPSTVEPWRRTMCLRRCNDDSQCASGMRCRQLPPSVPIMGQGWPRVCFADHPLDTGMACRAANDRLAHEQCLGGLCADLGALGVCSLDCSKTVCPSGSACADFGDKRLCVRICSPSFGCREDPLLSCNPSGRAGMGTFTVAGGDPEAVYCTPRPCESDAECGPAGRCQDGAPKGICVRRS